MTRQGRKDAAYSEDGTEPAELSDEDMREEVPCARRAAMRTIPPGPADQDELGDRASAAPRVTQP